jgi:signal transduction histidine kinase
LEAITYRVFEHLKLEYFRLDKQLQVTTWSEGLQTYFAKPLQIGLDVREIFPVAGDWQSNLHFLLEGRQAVFSLPVLLAANYLQVDFFAEGEEILAVVSDITESQKEKQALETLVDDLKKQIASLTQIKSTFLATAPHELRSPLTSVHSFIELVVEGGTGTLNSDQLNYLTIALNSVKRLLTLINDLLDIEQIESGNLNIEPFVFNLPNLIQLVADNYLADLERDNLKLSLQNNTGLTLSELLVDADMGRIEQVVTNLLVNAIKYNRPDKMIEISFELKEGNLITNFKDEGIGIAKEDQKKLFQRFYRASNATQYGARGNGLGLSIANVIIQRHSGKIWFESKLNEGSIFSFSLPLFIENAQINE